MNVFTVLYQAVFAYIVLFVLSKLLGKKQIAQLEFTDYAVGISIGSIAAAMAIEPELPVYHFIVAMAVFAAIDILLSILARKAVFLKNILRGKPLILIEKGNINYKNLKKSKLDLNELLSQLRIKNYFNISEIEYCIFESDGNLSILPKSEAAQITAKDMNLPKKQVELSKEVILDGKIIFSALNQIEKNRSWLFEKLKVKYQSEITNILLATYDREEKTLFVYFKDGTEYKEIKE